MRFDTEEAYFRAMRIEAKNDPQGIVREFRHREMSLSWDERFRQHVPGKGKSAADTFLAGAVVSLIRAAYSVHQKALDRRSAVTFWLPKSACRREEMAQAFERIAAIFRDAPPATGLD